MFAFDAKNSFIENDELLIKVDIENLNSVLLFLKTDNKCSFKQLVDIVAVDYPNNDKRFHVKAKINKHTGSNFTEQKILPDYYQ